MIFEIRKKKDNKHKMWKQWYSPHKYLEQITEENIVHIYLHELRSFDDLRNKIKGV